MRALCSVMALLALAACATTAPAPEPVFEPVVAPETMVAAIRAAAGDADTELAVQPLRDPMVEDLRQQAMQLEGKRLYRAAADALDQALAINANDPALLQERAEAALLLREFEAAEVLARRAFELGARVGPLCRRHWSTIEQVRLAHDDAPAAAAAKAQVAACRVAGPNRF